jgi:hypothetical protein
MNEWLNDLWWGELDIDDATWWEYPEVKGGQK